MAAFLARLQLDAASRLPKKMMDDDACRASSGSSGTTSISLADCPIGESPRSQMAGMSVTIVPDNARTHIFHSVVSKRDDGLYKETSQHILRTDSSSASYTEEEDGEEASLRPQRLQPRDECGVHSNSTEEQRQSRGRSSHRCSIRSPVSSCSPSKTPRESPFGRNASHQNSWPASSSPRPCRWEQCFRGSENAAGDRSPGELCMPKRGLDFLPSKSPLPLPADATTTHKAHSVSPPVSPKQTTSRRTLLTAASSAPALASTSSLSFNLLNSADNENRTSRWSAIVTVSTAISMADDIMMDKQNRHRYPHRKYHDPTCGSTTQHKGVRKSTGRATADPPALPDTLRNLSYSLLSVDSSDSTSPTQTSQSSSPPSQWLATATSMTA